MSEPPLRRRRRTTNRLASQYISSLVRQRRLAALKKANDEAQVRLQTALYQRGVSSLDVARLMAGALGLPKDVRTLKRLRDRQRKKRQRTITKALRGSVGDQSSSDSSPSSSDESSPS